MIEILTSDRTDSRTGLFPVEIPGTAGQTITVPTFDDDPAVLRPRTTSPRPSAPIVARTSRKAPNTPRVHELALRLNVAQDTLRASYDHENSLLLGGDWSSDCRPAAGAVKSALSTGNYNDGYPFSLEYIQRQQAQTKEAINGLWADVDAEIPELQPPTFLGSVKAALLQALVNSGRLAPQALSAEQQVANGPFLPS